MRYFLVAVLLLGLGCTQGNETPEAGFREGSNAYWRGDYNAALRHLMPAAEAGHPRAQEILGVMYRHGRGVGQDYGEAIKWYCRAAVQGDGRALSNLGFMYRRGMGVPQDNVEAVKWYRMAADIGNAGGQINMGFRYLDGEGIPEDHPSAYLWFSLAAKQDFDGARRAEEMRQETEKMLWPDQLKAAKIAVRVWKPEPFNEALAVEVRNSQACSQHLQ